MTIIHLDRRFIVWSETKGTDPELLSYFDATGHTLRWEELLEKHRVVVLAEAGSGKTAELEEQARLTAAQDRFTFQATVQNVGVKGLEVALGSLSARQLEDWRAS